MGQRLAAVCVAGCLAGLLAETVGGVHTHSDGVAAVVGYLLVAAFAACYLIALPAGWTGRSRRYRRLYLACVAFTVAECFARNTRSCSACTSEY